MQLNSYSTEQFAKKFGKYYTYNLKSENEKITRNLSKFIYSHQYSKTEIINFFEKFFEGKLKDAFNLEVTEHLGNIRENIIYVSDDDRAARGVFYDIEKLKQYVAENIVFNMKKVFKDNVLSKMGKFIYGNDRFDSIATKMEFLNASNIFNHINFNIIEFENEQNFFFPADIEEKLFSKNNYIFKLGSGKFSYELYNFYVDSNGNTTAVIEIIQNEKHDNTSRFVGITYKKMTNELVYNEENFTFDYEAFKNSIINKIKELNNEISELEKMI